MVGGVEVHRPGVRVTAADQPRLADLVESAVRTAALRPRHRVWLVARPEVAANVVGWRRHLHIGLTLLACLDESELRSLVARALSTVEHPYAGLVRRMVTRWERTHIGLQDDDVPPRQRRERERIRAALDDLALDVLRAADAGGGAGRWRERGSRAGGGAPEGGLVRAPPVCLHRHGEGDCPGAAQPILNQDGVRWYTFADAPASWWVDRAAEDTDSVRRDVAIVLDRPPVDHLEILDVLLNRSDEMAAVMDVLSGLPEDLDDEPADGQQLRVPPVAAGIVEDALLARGWRLEHPAVRGVLVGPSGERVDALALVAYGDDGTADLTALRAVLRP